MRLCTRLSLLLCTASSKKSCMHVQAPGDQNLLSSYEWLQFALILSRLYTVHYVMTDEKILYTTCIVGLIRFINNSEGKQLRFLMLDVWIPDFSTVWPFHRWTCSTLLTTCTHLLADLLKPLHRNVVRRSMH